jgi:hypothetical protein
MSMGVPLVIVVVLKVCSKRSSLDHDIRGRPDAVLIRHRGPLDVEEWPLNEQLLMAI